jgi:glyoxylase-like metal-dependent hydrolase (beta-lactamase superfamily II)
MIITSPGPVTDRILLLGREESCLYLIKGKDAYAILGGGMAYAAPEVLEQLSRYNVDESMVRYLVIHHAHFDHVGLIPFLKKRWPHAEIVGSQRARDLLARPDVVETIVGFNKGLLEQYGLAERVVEFGLDWETIPVDRVMEDGDEIDLGGLSLKFLCTPGHSSCSMSVYIPEEKALSASDAGGIPFGDNVFAAANSNFDLYQSSLEKMAELDVEVHMAEHYGARTGREGQTFITRSIDSARATRQALEDVYRRTGDVEQSIEEVTDHMMTNAGDYFLPREVMAMVTGQMFRFIARQMDQSADKRS